jgi:hypothetical protein
MQRRLPTQTGIIEFEMQGGHRELPREKLHQTWYAFCPNQGGYRNADVQTVHRHRLFGRRDGDSEPKGVARLLGEGDASPIEVPPSASPRKYCTRRGIVPTLVDIDHAFSFPIR